MHYSHWMRWHRFRSLFHIPNRVSYFILLNYAQISLEIARISEKLLFNRLNLFTFRCLRRSVTDFVKPMIWCHCLMKGVTIFHMSRWRFFCNRDIIPNIFWTRNEKKIRLMQVFVYDHSADQKLKSLLLRAFVYCGNTSWFGKLLWNIFYLSVFQSFEKWALLRFPHFENICSIFVFFQIKLANIFFKSFYNTCFSTYAKVKVKILTLCLNNDSQSSKNHAF